MKKTYLKHRVTNKPFYSTFANLVPLGQKNAPDLQNLQIQGGLSNLMCVLGIKDEYPRGPVLMRQLSGSHIYHYNAAGGGDPLFLLSLIT